MIGAYQQSGHSKAARKRLCQPVFAGWVKMCFPIYLHLPRERAHRRVSVGEYDVDSTMGALGDDDDDDDNGDVGDAGNGEGGVGNANQNRFSKQKLGPQARA